MEEIKMDNEGYNAFLEEIKKVEKKLNDVRYYKGTVAIFQGDNWHDNPTLYSTESEERTLMKQLHEMREKLKKIQIIEKTNDDSLIVDIGDILNISLIELDEEPIEMMVKLVSFSSNFNDELTEITINSPLGKAIYKKHIGETISYNVDDRKLNVSILEKINLEKDGSKSKKKTM